MSASFPAAFHMLSALPGPALHLHTEVTQDSQTTRASKSEASSSSHSRGKVITGGRQLKKTCRPHG